MKILYISYTGILEPLGESQVLSYLRLLSKNYQCKIFLITFEKSKYLLQGEILKKEIELNKNNITWKYFPYKYNNRIFRSFRDILKILLFFIKNKNEINLVHCRSYIPAITGYIINKVYGNKYIFDMRGFWIDEMILNKTLSNKLLISILRFLEEKLIINSSYIISLSNKAIKYLKSQKKYENKKYVYIPTCVDTKKFNSLNKSNNNDKIVIGCVGTIQSGWFLTEFFIDFCKIFQKKYPNSEVKIITNDETKIITNLLKKNDISKYTVKNCNSDNIVDEIKKLDLNIMFFSGDFAKIASCPTRLPESLSCGVPVIANKGLGDLEKIIKTNNVGILLEEYTYKEITNAVEQTRFYIKNQNIKKNCRNLALKNFDINVGVNSIYKIYLELSKK